MILNLDGKKLTLDWNCLIEIEDGRPQSNAVKALVEHHRSGLCDVALLATSASENSRSMRFPGNAALFQERIQKLGLDDLPILLAPGVWGLTYLDLAFWVDEKEFEFLYPALWKAMFPKVNAEARSYLAIDETFDDEFIQSEALSSWRNRWCDVMSAYSHIYAKRDIFVTLNSRDFQKNGVQLAALGIGSILTPADCFQADRNRSEMCLRWPPLPRQQRCVKSRTQHPNPT